MSLNKIPQASTEKRWRAQLSSVERDPFVLEITGELSKGGSGGGGEAGEECATAEPLGPGKTATPALNENGKR